VVTIAELDAKIAALREEYKTARPSSRQIITRRARALQIAKEKIWKKQRYS
jgi:hypothetical protein